jgi:hypothetical protein
MVPPLLERLSRWAFNFAEFHFSPCDHPHNTLGYCSVRGQENKTLESLNLKDNRIGVDGAAHIAEALQVG